MTGVGKGTIHCAPTGENIKGCRGVLHTPLQEAIRMYKDMKNKKI